ncbi:GNAT family N-acetyltransferase [Xylanimonas allomyrinae]|uniref:GNAT family N-acetyltransferase n=1 Tax=Xylanimonas allomyrinae TaxID=2509459 RepID=UPI0014771DC8|nr:GNAT family N-acetyltransferase [Xylanimonas allomyrinae]
MADVEIERVATPAQLDEAFAVRLDVFVDEQRVPRELELDDLDHAPTTTHVLARHPGGVAVGTARLLVDARHPDVVHIGRVAVRAQARGTGAGRALMGALEEIALAEHGARGSVTVQLSAQVQAIGFYERLGYQVSGPVYLDAGIDHRDAEKVLTA